MLPAEERKRVAEAVTGHNWSIPPINPVHVFPVNRSVGAWEPETNAKHWRALVGFLAAHFHVVGERKGKDEVRLFAVLCMDAVGKNDVVYLERMVLEILDMAEDV